MNETTQKGIAALKAGNRTQARQLLASAVLENDHDVTAWLWLAATLEKDEDRLRCLRQALRIDPENAAARQGIAQIEANRAAHTVDEPRRGADRRTVTRPLTPPPAAVNTVSDAPVAAEPAPSGHTQPVKVTPRSAGQPPSEPLAPAPPPAVVRTDLESAEPSPDESTEPGLDRSVETSSGERPGPDAAARQEIVSHTPADEEFTLPVHPDESAPEVLRLEELFPPFQADEPAPHEAAAAAANPPPADAVPAHTALPDSGPSANPGPLPNSLNNRRSQAGRPPTDGGKLIFRTRPSLVPALICFWVFLIGAIGIAWLLYDAPKLGLPIAGGLGLMLELIVLYVILRNLTTQYELTTRTLTLRQRGQRVHILTSDIYGVEIRQTAFQRLLGAGALLIDASVHGELAHFTLRDVPDCRLRLLQIRAQAGIPTDAPGHSVSAML